MTPSIEAFTEYDKQQLGLLGREMSAARSSEQLAAWCGELLRKGLAWSEGHESVLERVVIVATTPPLRGEGRQLMSEVRKLTNSAERAKADAGRLGILHLAELAAKLAYNATSPKAPFDADTPYWIPSCVQSLVKWHQNPAAKRELFDLLVRSEPPPSAPPSM